MQEFLANDFQVIGTTQVGTPDFTHDNLHIYNLDLTVNESVDRLTQTLKESGGKIDILINNAGVMLDEDDIDLKTDKLRQTLEVNLMGTANLTEKLLPMISPGGHIVFISSAAGSLQDMDTLSSSHSPYHYPAYKISKAGLNMYARTLAARLTHENLRITVSAIHPGWVKTDMGGDEAPVMPEDAAKDIYKLAISKPETGQFWFKDKKYPW